uniref:Uncharacterized protein n=1 Tax=Pseudonaja textilis TaxID=8673 RepID=A0A670YXG2_PSETE
LQVSVLSHLLQSCTLPDASAVPRGNCCPAQSNCGRWGPTAERLRESVWSMLLITATGLAELGRTGRIPPLFQVPFSLSTNRAL